MIDQMINFMKSIPEEASEYHKMDMLLSRMERLEMLPPDHDYEGYDRDDIEYKPDNTWEKE